MKTSKYIILDVETGGLKPTDNPIVELACLSLHNETFEEISRMETYVRQYEGLKIEPKALEANGIKLADIAKGISHQELFAKLIEEIKLANPTGKKATRPILVGHNVNFDAGFLKVLFKLNKAEFYDHFNEVYVDTLLMAKLLWDGTPLTDGNSYNLSTCCERMGINLINAHRAMNDVVATKDLFLAIKSRMRNGGGSGTMLSNSSGGKKERPYFQF